MITIRGLWRHVDSRMAPSLTSGERILRYRMIFFFTKKGKAYG